MNKVLCWLLPFLAGATLLGNVSHEVERLCVPAGGETDVLHVVSEKNLRPACQKVYLSCQFTFPVVSSDSFKQAPVTVRVTSLAAKAKLGSLVSMELSLFSVERAWFRRELAFNPALSQTRLMASLQANRLKMALFRLVLTLPPPIWCRNLAFSSTCSPPRRPRTKE